MADCEYQIGPIERIEMKLPDSLVDEVGDLFRRNRRGDQDNAEPGTARNVAFSTRSLKIFTPIPGPVGTSIVPSRAISNHPRILEIFL